MMDGSELIWCFRQTMLIENLSRNAIWYFKFKFAEYISIKITFKFYRISVQLSYSKDDVEQEKESFA